MKRPETDADSQFICPMCGMKTQGVPGGTLKKIGDTDTDGNVSYGCYVCGYLAKFNAKFLDAFIQQRLEAPENK
jgi:rubredoxin